MGRGRPQNLVGQTFGRLQVIRLADRSTRRGRWWVCQCSCGEVREVRGDNLTGGRTVSCGCYLQDIKAKRVKPEGRRPGRPRKYGCADDNGLRAKHPREAEAWRRMIAACNWPSSKSYEKCGARGLTVHKPWLDSFRTFLEDVGARSGPGLVLVRRDPLQGYHPGNVRWGERGELTRAPTDPEEGPPAEGLEDDPARAHEEGRPAPQESPTAPDSTSRPTSSVRPLPASRDPQEAIRTAMVDF